jgi:hypothetical protein
MSDSVLVACDAIRECEQELYRTSKYLLLMVADV